MNRALLRTDRILASLCMGAHMWEDTETLRNNYVSSTFQIAATLGA